MYFFFLLTFAQYSSEILATRDIDNVCLIQLRGNSQDIIFKVTEKGVKKNRRQEYIYYDAGSLFFFKTVDVNYLFGCKTAIFWC